MSTEFRDSVISLADISPKMFDLVMLMQPSSPKDTTVDLSHVPYKFAQLFGNCAALRCSLDTLRVLWAHPGNLQNLKSLEIIDRCIWSKNGDWGHRWLDRLRRLQFNALTAGSIFSWNTLNFIGNCVTELSVTTDITVLSNRTIFGEREFFDKFPQLSKLFVEFVWTSSDDLAANHVAKIVIRHNSIRELIIVTEHVRRIEAIDFYIYCEKLYRAAFCGEATLVSHLNSTKSLNGQYHEYSGTESSVNVRANVTARRSFGNFRNFIKRLPSELVELAILQPITRECGVWHITNSLDYLTQLRALIVNASMLCEWFERTPSTITRLHILPCSEHTAYNWPSDWLSTAMPVFRNVELFDIHEIGIYKKWREHTPAVGAGVDFSYFRARIRDGQDISTLDSFLSFPPSCHTVVLDFAKITDIYSNARTTVIRMNRWPHVKRLFLRVGSRHQQALRVEKRDNWSQMVFLHNREDDRTRETFFVQTVVARVNARNERPFTGDFGGMFECGDLSVLNDIVKTCSRRYRNELLSIGASLDRIVHNCRIVECTHSQLNWLCRLAPPGIPIRHVSITDRFYGPHHDNYPNLGLGIQVTRLKVNLIYEEQFDWSKLPFNCDRVEELFVTLNVEDERLRNLFNDSDFLRVFPRLSNLHFTLVGSRPSSGILFLKHRRLRLVSVNLQNLPNETKYDVRVVGRKIKTLLFAGAPFQTLNSLTALGIADEFTRRALCFESNDLIDFFQRIDANQRSEQVSFSVYELPKNLRKLAIFETERAHWRMCSLMSYPRLITLLCNGMENFDYALYENLRVLSCRNSAQATNCLVPAFQQSRVYSYLLRLSGDALWAIPRHLDLLEANFDNYASRCSRLAHRGIQFSCLRLFLQADAIPEQRVLDKFALPLTCRSLILRTTETKDAPIARSRLMLDLTQDATLRVILVDGRSLDIHSTFLLATHQRVYWYCDGYGHEPNCRSSSGEIIGTPTRVNEHEYSRLFDTYDYKECERLLNRLRRIA